MTAGPFVAAIHVLVFEGGQWMERTDPNVRPLIILGDFHPGIDDEVSLEAIFPTQNSKFKTNLWIGQ